MKRRGIFIVLEGADKSGKSTLAGFLARRLGARGIPVTHTREPGGTSFAEAVRRILLNPERRVHPLAELFLYEAARAQHTHELIRPALNAGRLVLCERYTLATLVYQGCARGLPLPLIRRLNRAATGGLRPDLTLALDIPEREFGRRKRRRPLDRLEKESSLFRRKVRRGYRRLVRREPNAFLIDADRDLKQIEREALERVEKILPRGLRA